MKVVITCLEFARMQRARSMAEGLALAGHEVVFVTAEAGAPDPRYDTVVVPFTSAGQRAKRAAGLDASANAATEARKRGRAVEWLVRAAARTYETLLQFPDKYRGWIPAVRAWLATQPSEIEGADVVLASFGPATGALVGRAIAQRLGAPLVIDFRDLWTDNPYYPYGPLRRSMERVAERRLVRTAAALTCVTDSLADALRTRHPGSQVVALYTGVDPVPWHAAPRRADGTLRLGFFGTTYGGLRSAKGLLLSLGHLLGGGRADAERIRIHMVGDIDGSVARDAAVAGVTRSLAIEGPIPQAEVPGRLAGIDVALILMWPEDTGAVPLKAYHYLAAGKQILILGTRPDSELRLLLSSLPGVDCPDTDAELDACLVRYWGRVTSGGTMHWSLEERPLPVTRESMTSELVAVLEGARNR